MDNADTLDVPQPAALIPDDPAGVDAARQRFAKKHRFSLANLRRRRSRKSLKDEATEPVPELRVEDELPLSSEFLESAPIRLGESSPSIVTYNHDDSHDHYEWAVVYENQRGCVLSAFSRSFH